MTIASLAPHLDRLNSWVRSPGARDWMSSPRRAIYDLKQALIKRAMRECVCDYRVIYLSLTCRDCGGTRRYTDWNGYTWPHCRRCSSTGVTRLEFLETTIAGFKWHTPKDRTWELPILNAFENASLSTDWEPNAVGKDLELWQVVESLNVLEAEMPGTVGSHDVYDRDNYFGRSDHKKYRLFLGRSDRVCEFCKKDAQPKEGGFFDGLHHHAGRGSLEWCAWVCDACRKEQFEWKYWDRLAVPTERLEHPEIQIWLERRAVAIGDAA